MQPLQDAIKPECSSVCAEAVIDAVPPVLWFIRRQMRSHRKDLSLPQFRVLVCVEQDPHVSLSTVADFLGASLPTTSRIVSGLVNKQLLERADRFDDRRQLSLQLTQEGLSLMERARLGTHAEVRAKLKNLEPGQRRTVTEAMFILRDIFGATGFSLGGESIVVGDADSADVNSGTLVADSNNQ